MSLEAIKRRALELFNGELTLPRLTVALGSLSWAFILLFLPFQFDRPSYVHLAAIAPQWMWGVAFALVGLLQFVRALLDVPLTQGSYACVVAGLTAWLWWVVTVALAMSLSPPPAMVSGNLSIAILAGFIFIRTVSKRG